MKKALVVLLALVLGAGLLFAADAKWGAWIEGDVVLYNDAGQAGITPSWAGAGPYNTLSLSYSEDNFGFAMTDEFAANNWGVALRDIKGWYKLFDGMLKVSAGRLRIGDYRPTSFVEGSSVVTRILNAEWGALLQLTPVEGLSVGVGAEFPVPIAAADYANKMVFGVSYDIKDIAKVYLNYRMLNDQLGASVEVKAIKGLPILLGFAYDTTSSQINALLSASYTMDKLSFAVDAVMQYTTALAFAVEANVGYALSDMYKVGMNLAYDDGYGWTTDFTSGFGVYPWVNVTVGSGSLNLGFALSTGAPLTWKIPLKYVIAF